MESRGTEGRLRVFRANEQDFVLGRAELGDGGEEVAQLPKGLRRLLSGKGRQVDRKGCEVADGRHQHREKRAENQGDDSQRRRVRQPEKGVRLLQRLRRLLRKGRREAPKGLAGEIPARGWGDGEDVSLVGRLQAYPERRREEVDGQGRKIVPAALGDERARKGERFDHGPKWRDTARNGASSSGWLVRLYAHVSTSVSSHRGWSRK